MSADITIPLVKTLLPPSSFAEAKPLVGFDVGDDLFHVMLFPDEQGSIGILKEGDNFCARISLNSLAAFWANAKATHIESNA